MSKPPRVLAFDVFGTVVDWHSSITKEVTRFCPSVDANAFALAWRDGYQPAMQRVASGELGWTLIDDLHLMILRDVLKQFKVSTLTESEVVDLNKAWRRLAPWEDTLEGMQRLREKFMLCSLSNGNIGLLANMAKNAKLPWDCILSAEIFRHYKPHPQTYLGVARIFDVQPDDILMVAAHQDDLAGARACGLQTAYIQRPMEFGPTRFKDVSDNGLNTYHATNLIALADMLDA
jgi:2-haloacid dehalogenase